MSREYLYNEELEEDAPKSRIFSKRRAALWIFVGFFIVTLAYIRDLYHFWTIIYKNIENQNDSTDDIKVDQECIKCIQHTLKSFDNNDINLNEFIHHYNFFESSTLNDVIKSNSYLLNKRQTQIKHFFKYWIVSNKLKIIKKDIIKAILPVYGYYSERYIERISHIRINWIFKAIASYKNSIKTIKIDDVMIPKYIVNNENLQVKQIFRKCKDSKTSFINFQKTFNKIRKIMQWEATIHS